MHYIQCNIQLYRSLVNTFIILSALLISECSAPPFLWVVLVLHRPGSRSSLCWARLSRPALSTSALLMGWREEVVLGFCDTILLPANTNKEGNH